MRRMRNLGFAVVLFFGLTAMAGIAQIKINDNHLPAVKQIVKIERY